MGSLIRKVVWISCALCVTVATLGALCVTQARAEYPTKEIRLIQPYPAGGFNDVMARKLIDVIAKQNLLSKTVLTVAMPGANCRTALEAVLDSEPDGTTLLVHHNQLITAKLSGQIPTGYEQFEMLGGLCAGPIVFDVAKDSKWKTIQELVADAKANPGKYTMGLPGSGGVAHIAALHFLKLAGIPIQNFRYLPLSGGSETLTAVLGHKVEFRTATAADAMRGMLSGDTRVLVVLSHQNLAAFKGVPNLKDLGYPDSVEIRLGVFAPKGISQEVKDKWAEILKTAASSEDFKAFAEERGSPAKYLSPVEWKKQYESDTAIVSDVLKEIQGKK